MKKIILVFLLFIISFSLLGSFLKVEAACEITGVSPDPINLTPGGSVTVTATVTGDVTSVTFASNNYSVFTTNPYNDPTSPWQSNITGVSAGVAYLVVSGFTTSGTCIDTKVVQVTVGGAATPTPTPVFVCPAADSWCTNHGGIYSAVPYDVTNWFGCRSWCDTVMNQTNYPICQYNADGLRNCWVNYAPPGGVRACSWSGSHPPYGAVWSGYGCPRSGTPTSTPIPTTPPALCTPQGPLDSNPADESSTINSIYLTWNFSGGTQEQVCPEVRWRVQGSGSAWSTAPLVHKITYTITGLNPSTTYEIYIKSYPIVLGQICSDGAATCNFGNPAGSVNSTIPLWVIATTASPTSTPTPTPPTLTPVPPTATPVPGCLCNTDGTCAAVCAFDKFAPPITYANTIKCNLASSLFPTPPTAANKTSWCQATKRTKGDADGNGIINTTDYFYYVAAVNGGQIPVLANPDFNGDGEVGAADRTIIIKSLP